MPSVHYISYKVPLRYHRWTIHLRQGRETILRCNL